jgi:hypothetical protein
MILTPSKADRRINLCSHICGIDERIKDVYYRSYQWLNGSLSTLLEAALPCNLVGTGGSLRRGLRLEQFSGGRVLESWGSPPGFSR